jgi:hypothetical protein
MMTSSTNPRNGYITIYVLIFSSVAMIVLVGLLQWADVNRRGVFRDYDRAQAFMIAESGLEYYRWHLAHAPTDYTDGTASAGPYVHDFLDMDGNVIGTFSLDITPPLVGSTVIPIESTGAVTIDPTVTKVIEAWMAIPSFVKYAAVIGSSVRFGEGTELYGPVHSNGGIRMDGIAHNLVTSSVASYDDPDHSGAVEHGVHTHIAPTDALPPAAVPNRPDIFMAGREFPVAPADFVGITQDLALMKTDAQSSGSYRGPSGAQGYEIIFNTNDTYNLRRVNSLMSAPSNCTNVQNQSGWGTWTVNGTTNLGTFAMPSNGLIFVEDNVWVRGQINSARVTVASGRFPDNPSTRSSITVTSDLLYTNYDGQDVISLVSQNNINIGMNSDTDLRIDAALMAQNGRVGRYYYRPPGGGQNRCSPYHTRTTITSFGMIGSYTRYGFAYTDNTGYTNRIIIYDANLLYAPPPSFPLTADYYTIIYWNEAQ